MDDSPGNVPGRNSDAEIAAETVHDLARQLFAQQASRSRVWDDLTESEQAPWRARALRASMP